MATYRSDSIQTKSPLPPSLEEVHSALDDVRRIRDLLDTSHRNHPLRRAFRPMVLMGLVFGPISAVAGVLMQRVMDAPGATVWGLAKPTMLWLIGGLALFLVSVVKMLVMKVSAAREGYRLGGFLRRIFNAGYVRILVAIFSLAAVACGMAVQLGASGLIAGILTMAWGALLIAMPLALPLPESTTMGAFLLLGGALAVFVLPGYPFYKVAVLWGIGFGLIMPLGHWALAAPSPVCDADEENPMALAPGDDGATS